MLKYFILSICTLSLTVNAAESNVEKNEGQVSSDTNSKKEVQIPQDQSSTMIAPKIKDIEYDFGGQFRLRNLHKELSASTKDLRNVTQMRMRLEMDVKLNKDILFHVAPQATKNFGEVITEANDENSTVRNSSGDKYHTAFDIFEAYVESETKYFTYKLGRQTLAYGENVVLGTRNWTPGGLVFDAGKLTIPLFTTSLDLVYSEISEGASVNEGTDNKVMMLAYWKLLQDKDLNLDLYYLSDDDKANLETQNYGGRFKAKFSNFDFRTENIFQHHRQSKEDEFTLNFELGYEAFQDLRFFIGHAEASSNYDHLYTNRHAYNGIIDIVGRKNLDTMNGGFSYKFDSAFSMNMEYLAFKQHELNNGVYNQATSAVIAGNLDERDVGQELDLRVAFKPNKYEKFLLGASHFEHGAYFSTDYDKSDFVYLEYLLKF